MATARTGKPYIYVTWLAKLLGGQQCLWSAWFKAHYRYDKHEEQALDLVQWNREHSALMRARVRELEEDGWTVTTEEENAFKLEGVSAVVAGKPDIVAVKPGRVLVVDGKTGRERESDVWQVLFYLFALQKSRLDLKGELEGEVHYKRGDARVTVTPSELTTERLGQIVTIITAVAGKAAPRKVPSAHECKVCNIGKADCPQRISDRQPVLAGEF